MGSALKISDAEMEVMAVIWEEAPVTSSQVIGSLSGCTDWKPNTIMTMIRRLVKKGVLSYEKDGKAYVYSPLVTKEECIEEVGDSFMNRFFDGSLMPMLAHFTSNRTLTKEEKDALRRLLEEE